MNIYRHFNLCLVFIAGTTVAFGQSTEKQPLDIDALRKWNNGRNAQLSGSGNLFSYELTPNDGQGWLYYGDTMQGVFHTYHRGEKAKLSPGGNVVLFNIAPPKDTVDAIKLAKQNKEKGGKKLKPPQDSLGVYFLDADTLLKFPFKDRYQVPADSGELVAFSVKRLPKGESKEKEAEGKNWWQKLFGGKKAEKAPKKHKPSPKVMFYSNGSAQPDSVQHVKTFTLSDAGNAIGYVQSTTDTLDSLQVKVYDQESGMHRKIFETSGEVKSLSFDKQGNQLVFLHSVDTNKQKQYDLFYWAQGQDTAKKLIGGKADFFPTTYSLSEHGKVYFSDNGKRLFFGYGKAPEPDRKDTVLNEDKPVLDIWSWHDDRLQPHQKNRLKKDKRASYLAVHHLPSGNNVMIGDSVISRVKLIRNGDADIAFGIDDNSALKRMSWEWPLYRHIYKINLNTGVKTLLLEDQQYPYSISPNGKYIAHYNPEDRDWYLLDVLTGESANITASIPTEFHNREDDTPNEPRPYGVDEWTDSDQHVIIRDEFDLWVIPTKKPKNFYCLTKSFGRKSKMRFRIYRMDKYDKTVSLNDHLFLGAFSEKTKESGFYRVLKGSLPEKVEWEPGYRTSLRGYSTHGEYLLWTKQNFQGYPDLYYSTADFNTVHRISNANPQQDNYLWGTNELTKWRSADGDTLEGLIFKPENFDLDKKYPMMVYFYETYSDLLHYHFRPSPSASTINPTHYVSNGYVVFIPDITYRKGHPGKSAVEDVVSGTEHMISLGYVDPDKIGIQGQSWGGYQVAYIVTQTDMFTAAMAGAPVSNMTSAYGGIRWGSGISRMFQYEETQSRIGGDLWEARDLYIENSPVFFADQVETPLLIMHNDDDGAVPWYQGIEFFVALRRLEKPVWMLTYNQDKHNLTKMPNKIDLTIRMKQFFDHYLMDEPSPEWMEYGLPAVKKGEEYRYDLIEEDKN